MSIFKRSSSAATYRITSPDYVFIGLTAVILLLGLLFLSSATSVVGFQSYQDSYYFLKHQLVYGLLPGLVLFWFLSVWPYQRLKALAVPALIFSVVALLAVFLPGLGFAYGGARRWLDFGSFVVQPSEFVKLAFLLYLSAWLANRGEEIRDLKAGLVPFIITLGIILGLVILQPDVGTTTVIAVSSVVVFFVAGARLSHLAALGGLGGALLWLVVKLAPYRVARLTVFLHPEFDPQGIGYHINQALLAVGSGGWFGVGLGYSRQKHQYLPQVTGDSIFAVVAEELGFVLTTLFLLVITAWFVRAFRIVRSAPDNFGRILGSGILAWLGWQMCINIASMLNLLPLTGVPLPFVSAGGTALVTALGAVGILVNMSRQVKTS
ncbi:MAG: putative lipid II flippase FtsW [Candidatus Veblenbacteria bacterium]|nr:putative lipid II flippase FtsW [Candidatus Veblenbacteria bacterium]MDZ4230008.1 putative lipid II flippase FtsW [Candidatus Veblenbacteria bacterium]